jgi:hypothetical protein
MGWMVQGLNSGGGKICRAIKTGPEVNPVMQHRMDTGSFLGVKQPEGDADHPLYLSARLQVARSFTSLSPLCLHKYVLGRHLALQKKLNTGL